VKRNGNAPQENCGHAISVERLIHYVVVSAVQGCKGLRRRDEKEDRSPEAGKELGPTIIRGHQDIKDPPKV
jgi:hypothetical protein